MSTDNPQHSYTGRGIEAVEIRTVHDDGQTVTWTNGWSFGGIPPEHHHLLTVGAEFLLETQGFSTITGMATMFRTRAGEPVVDQWLWHKTDADLDREHAEMVAGFRRKRETQWATHQDAWRRREEALPSPLRRRLDRFRSNGGHDFEIEGWGYELIVCELAVLYAKSDQADSDEVMAYSSNEGTSGNQHDMAKALSRLLTDDVENQDAIANAPSALAPLTGDLDYSGTRR
jgi:hypothetical protein